jgi:soluble lytic murein transglycosylase-like protein
MTRSTAVRAFAATGLVAVLAGCEMPAGIDIPDLARVPSGTPSFPGRPSAAPAGKPAPAPATPTGGMSVKGEAAVRPLAVAAATKEGLPTGLVLAVVAQESAFDSRAVSGAGAQGLMQLMPGTVTHINGASDVKIVDPFDPTQNLAGGCWYLKWVRAQVPAAKVAAGEEWQFALAGYNGGIGRVRTAIDKALAGAPREPKARFADVAGLLPAETRAYVPAVVARWDKYGR